MLIFSVIFVFSTLTLSPRPLCLEKWGVMPPSSYGSAAPVSGGVKCTGGKVLRFLTEIAVYYGNGTKYVHGYCGSLTGSDIGRSIRVCSDDLK